MRKSRRGNGYYGRCTCLMMTLCIAICLAGCSAEDVLGMTGEDLLAQAQQDSVKTRRTLSLEELESKDAAKEATQNAGEAYHIAVGDSLLYEGGSTYALEELSEGEKIWYRDMEQALGNMQGTVKLSEAGLKAGLDESHVDKIFQSVLNDHPELFYVEGYSYTKYTKGTRTVAVDFTGTYSCDAETAYYRKQEIELAVDEMLQPALQLEDDYEKIKYVYEALIERTDYDINALDNQNIYSVFVNRASVCQGYAKAFQYLMYRLDVDCALVQGKVIETGEGHAWNLVKSNNAYYYVDPTWGDISYQSTQSTQSTELEGEQVQQNAVQQTSEVGLPSISYDYLCITTDQLLHTHELTASEGLPICRDTKDNYYVREGALFEEYDEEQMTALVNKRLAEGRKDIAIRCSNKACYDEMREALLDRQELFSYLAGSGIQSFVYSCNESQMTLTFFMMTSNG